jgi:hypothetical protein
VDAATLSIRRKLRSPPTPSSREKIKNRVQASLRARGREPRRVPPIGLGSDSCLSRIGQYLLLHKHLVRFTWLEMRSKPRTADKPCNA